MTNPDHMDGFRGVPVGETHWSETFGGVSLRIYRDQCDGDDFWHWELCYSDLVRGYYDDQGAGWEGFDEAQRTAREEASYVFRQVKPGATVPAIWLQAVRPPAPAGPGVEWDCLAF